MVNSSQDKNTHRRSRSRFTREYQFLLNRLVESRKAAGVSQEEVARWLGKPQSHVSKIETGERELSIIDLWKWCGAIGLSFSQVIQEFESEIGQFEDPKRTRSSVPRPPRSRKRLAYPG
jgi:transcriptional regulator with XRE-family HTH domain